MAVSRLRCVQHPWWRFGQGQVRCEGCGTALITSDKMPPIIWSALKLFQWKRRPKAVRFRTCFYNLFVTN